MNNKKVIFQLVSLMMGIGGMNNNPYNDFLIFGDKKLLNYSVSLVLEIDDLLEQGYTKEEITELINKSNSCEKDSELSSEEGVILKEHAYHILEIRYHLFMEIKKEEKKKKYLFNK